MRPGPVPAALAAAIVLLLAGCGGGDDAPGPENADRTPEQPALEQGAGGAAAAPDLGFPSVATKNTTRVGGADAVANAAAVAQAVYPGRSRETRPLAVALADATDWRVAVSAAQLMGAPLRAPLLLAQGDVLPEASKQALGRLIPTGARRAGGAQVIRIGSKPDLAGFKGTDVEGADYAALAQAIDRFQIAAAGRPSRDVVVAPAEQPGFAMPAAGWAAKSGDPVLWVTRDAIPAATRAAITAHKRPRIHVLGPESAISNRVLRQLERARLGAPGRRRGPRGQRDRLRALSGRLERRRSGPRARVRQRAAAARRRRGGGAVGQRHLRPAPARRRRPPRCRRPWRTTCSTSAPATARTPCGASTTTAG